MPPANQKAQSHQWKQFLKRGYCVWCKEHPDEWEPKKASPILGEIVNGVRPGRRKRQSQAYGGCEDCNAYLCRKGNCFKRYHNK
jgi:hypothetical protein